MGLIGSVTFITKTTVRTAARRVARIHVDHAHARELRFVADKRSQLPKSPRMAHTSLRASNRDSLSYPVQGFERECLTLRLRLSNQRFADAMVDILLEALFSSRALAQSPTSTTSVCQLQSSAMVVSPLANRLHLLSAVGLARGVGGKVHKAQINAQVADWLVRGRRDLRLGDAQIPDIHTTQQLRAAEGLCARLGRLLPPCPWHSMPVARPGRKSRATRHRQGSAACSCW